MALGTRSFTRTELEEFLKAGGVCRYTDPYSWCIYEDTHEYPYRFYFDKWTISANMNGIWDKADGIKLWTILKRPSIVKAQLNLDELYPKRINFKT